MSGIKWLTQCKSCVTSAKDFFFSFFLRKTISLAFGNTELTVQCCRGVMEQNRMIGAREIHSPEFVRAPALQHAYRKGGEPSHKSKMEDLTVEVCGENGAYYKVRSVGSIQKSERRARAIDRPSCEPRCGRNLMRQEFVLLECTALKCSRANAASSDAMSRLTGRDFPFDSHCRVQRSARLWEIHWRHAPKWHANPWLHDLSAPCFPSRLRESRFHVQLIHITRYTPDSFKDNCLLYASCEIFFSGLCHRCLWRGSFGNFWEWVSFFFSRLVTFNKSM